MATTERDLAFSRVLSGPGSSRRTTLLLLPAVAVVLALVIFAVFAISRASGLATQVEIAQQQVQEANKVVDERDRQLRDAHAETAVLASPGQGAAVLASVKAGSGGSGIALDHPEQHALGVYAFNLAPPPADQQYRLIVTDGSGAERLLGVLAPDDRGGAFLLARDVPEGLTRLEVALVPKQGGDAAAAGSGRAQQAGAGAAAGADAPATRTPVLVGSLPRPGEAGVVAAPQASGKPRAQARRGR